MTIEFRCTECGKLLRTADDKAGMGANCPGCGAPIQVPYPEASPSPPSEPEPEGGEFDFGEAAEYERQAEPFGETSAPAVAEEMKTCPMCGQQIRAAAIKCRFCGEDLGRPAEVPTKIEAGDVISKSWQIFNAQMGICIGGVLLAGVINFAAEFLLSILDSGVPEPIADVASVVFSLMSLSVYLYMQLGVNILLLHVARGEPAEIGDLFQGGPYLLRMLPSSILVALALFVGFLLCFVPGIIVALIFWPYALVLVDKDPPGIDCLGQAKDITKNNWGAVFLISLATLGFNFVGACACYVGLIFTVPLMELMFVVAYCGMTGQRTIAG